MAVMTEEGRRYIRAKRRRKKRLKKPVPPELKRWNWGAFFLNWVWALRHGVRTWWYCFLPIVGPFWPFMLGLRGNEWAWKSGEWSDIDAYLKEQRIWSWFGIGAFAFLTLIGATASLWI
jgi:hypothetical protein